MATINIKNVEVSKAGVELKHTFVPKEINEGVIDSEKVKIVCNYFKSLQKQDYMSYGKDGSFSFKLRSIFLGQVEEIKNLTIKDELGQTLVVKTAQDVVDLPSIPAIENMMSEVVTHLLKSDELTEDEEKNSESAINSAEEDS